MPISQGIVGAPSTTSATDGTYQSILQGKQAEQIVAGLHGKNYTACYRGNVFLGSTAAAGVVPPIYSNTAQTFGLWNPTGSGKNIVPISLRYGIVTVGVVTSNFVLGYRADAGAQVATGGTISAATLVAAVNANLGSGTASISKFAPATITTVAPALLMTLGTSICMAAGPTAMNDWWQLGHDFDGGLIVAPGTAVFVANNIAGVATYNISLVWEEVPV
jgi:hypothetical protein